MIFLQYIFLQFIFDERFYDNRLTSFLLYIMPSFQFERISVSQYRADQDRL